MWILLRKKQNKKNKSEIVHVRFVENVWIVGLHYQFSKVFLVFPGGILKTTLGIFILTLWNVKSNIWNITIYIELRRWHPGRLLGLGPFRKIKDGGGAEEEQQMRRSESEMSLFEYLKRKSGLLEQWRDKWTKWTHTETIPLSRCLCLSLSLTHKGAASPGSGWELWCSIVLSYY